MTYAEMATAEIKSAEELHAGLLARHTPAALALATRMREGYTATTEEIRWAECYTYVERQATAEIDKINHSLTRINSVGYGERDRERQADGLRLRAGKLKTMLETAENQL